MKLTFGHITALLVPSDATITDAITTDTRMDIHFVVTEYGKVDLKGLSLNQRASAIIGLAPPKFRDDLTAAAGKLGLR